MCRRSCRKTILVREKLGVEDADRTHSSVRTEIHIMSNLLNRTVFFIVFLAVLSVLAIRVDAEASSADENFERLQALEWREVGPYRGGRSAAVSGVPTWRNVYYMGATGGGVWKTDDAGQSWNNISDGFFGAIPSVISKNLTWLMSAFES